MAVLPFTDARNRLSELIDEAGRTHERIEITRHGHPVAVLMSADDLAALEETLEVLSGPAAMRQLAEPQDAMEAGDVLDPDELAALIAKRSKRATKLPPRSQRPKLRVLHDGEVISPAGRSPPALTLRRPSRLASPIRDGQNP